MADFDPRAYAQQKLAEPKAFDPRAYAMGKLSSRIPEEPGIIEEMHPEFTTADRALVKNFSNDPVTAVAYLQKQHPGLEITQREGKILAKAPGEAQYRVLDPDTGISLKDLPSDLLDVAWDVPAGVAESAGTALGGVLGAGAGGIGALPGAAAGGALTAGGIETLRQALGKGIGVSDEMSGTDIVLSAATGAISPLLFGTGATAKQIGKAAEKQIAKTGAQYLTPHLEQQAKDAVVDSIGRSQRGVLGRGLDYVRDNVTPKLGELTSGIDSSIIKSARGALDELDELGKDQGMTKFVSETRKGVIDTFNDAQSGLGKKIEEAVDAAQGTVNLDKVKVPLVELHAKLDGIRQAHLNDPVMKATVDEVQQTINDVFQNNGGEVSARAAWEIKQRLKDLAEIATMPRGELTKGIEKRSIGDKRILSAAKQAVAEISRQLDEVAGIGQLNKQFEEIATLRKALAPFFKNDAQTMNRLTNLRDPSNRIKLEAMERADKLLGLDTVGAADKNTAFKNFSNAPWLAKSSGGSTSTSRTIPAALVGGALGYWAAANSGMGQGLAGPGALAGGALGAMIGGPKALRAYMKNGQRLDKISNFLRNSKAGSTLRPLQTGAGMASDSAWRALLERERGGGGS